MSDSIIEKIRKLLSKTTENGCTEAEAMSAAAMAVKIMDRHNIVEADVLAGQTEATDALFERVDHDHPVGYMSRSIGAFTGCRIYCYNGSTQTSTSDLFGGVTWERKEVRKLRIVGLAHEVEIAKYLLDICWVAMESVSGKALQSENDERAKHNEPQIFGNERKRWVSDFQRGMAARMSKTIQEMTADRQSDMPKVSTGSGRELEAVRNSLVADWFASRGITLRTASAAKVRHGSAFGAGQSAGGNVRFNAGVGNGQRSVAALR